MGFKGFSGGDFVDSGHVCFGSYLVSRWLGDVGERMYGRFENRSRTFEGNCNEVRASDVGGKRKEKNPR